MPSTSSVSKTPKASGFTLVEVLVIAPIIMISITIMIAVIITITGEVLRTQGTNMAIYDAQAALNQIDDDARMSTEFVATSYTPNSPQGVTGTPGNFDGSSAFSIAAAVNPAKLIVRTMSINQSNLSPTRDVNLRSNDGCGSWAPGPVPHTIDVVYFLKPNADGTQSLWRRALFGTYAVAGQTCWVNEWQKPSCTPGYTNTTWCITEDAKLLDNVSAMTVSYNYADGNSSATNPTNAVAVKVTIDTTDTVAGRTSTNTASITAKR